MTPEEMELGLRSHRDFLEQGNLDVVDEIYAPDCVIYGRNIPEEWRRGTAGFKAYGQMLREAFPDLKIIHESTVNDGQYQSIRWSFSGTHLGPLFGAPATGKSVSIEDGRISEMWVEQDMLALLRQIGLAPEPD
jgi:predicted ester cyclase